MRHQKFLLFRIYRFRDTRAYGQLYDFYYKKVRRHIYFKVPRGEDADELTAEVFLRGWEYITSSKVDHAGALFYRIARNVVADFYRSRSEEHSSEGMELSDESQLEEEVMQHDEQRRLIAQLKDIKEEYREVLVMRYLDELSVSEIAQILEKTPNNIRVTLHRAKRALKEVADE